MNIFSVVVFISIWLHLRFGNSTNNTPENQCPTNFLNNTFSGSTGQSSTKPKPPPIAYLLRVFSYYNYEAAVDTAFEVFSKRYPALLERLPVQLVRKYSRRDLTSSRGSQFDSQLALRTTVRSLNYDNETYLFIMGPDGAQEGKSVGQMTPVYNMVTVSGTSSGDALSDIKAYPLHFSTCARVREFNVAHKMFVQMLQFDKVASIMMDDFSVERIRNVENMLLADRAASIVAGHVLSRENLSDVARSLKLASPSAIITEFTQQNGPQAICNLYKLGIVPQDTVWIVSGPFYRVDWWEPLLPQQQNWNCTRDEMLAAVNGTLAIEAFLESPSQSNEDVARRVDQMNNAQLRTLLDEKQQTRYPEAASEGETNSRCFYVYDATMASLLAFYQAAEKFEQQHNVSVATLRGYPSRLFEAWSRTLAATLLETSFYGATGRVSISPDRHSGQATVQVSQFQSIAGNENGSAEYKWVLVGTTDFTTHTSKLWLEHLVFATETGKPPHVVKDRIAQLRRQTILLLSICAVVALVCTAALLALCIVRRARHARWRDTSWMIDAKRLSFSKATKSRISLLSNQSDASMASAFASMASFALVVDEGRLATLDGSIPMWTRPVLVTRINGAQLSNVSPVKLNREIFPLARAMHAIGHDNVNRFYGFASTGEKFGLSCFAYQQKSSVRHLLEDNKLGLEQEMKLLFLTDIVSGILVLHEAVGPHGFLHSNNLLLDERYTVKLTDYGLVKFQPLMSLMPVDPDGDLLYDDDVMEKLIYRAPELLRNGYFNMSEQSLRSCDVYSLGIIFVEVMTRQLTFAEFNDRVSLSQPADEIWRKSFQEGKKPVLVLSDIIRGTVPPTRPRCPPSSISASLVDLISLCWRENALQRPSPAQVLRQLKRLPGYRAGNVMQNMVKRLENFAQNLQTVVDERTQALLDEMQKTEQLLLAILPRSVAEELKKGNPVLPEAFDSVSVYFSDIVGFTSLSSASTPMEVVHLLNNLYTLFDSIISCFDVYKVETIGDAYMVASGVPERNGYRHCAELARMSLQLLEEIRLFEIPHRPSERLALRIGLHCGPCVAGVVGLKMPRYCLFGDTVNTASRMESNGAALKIHVSEQYYTMTTKNMPNLFDFILRGQLEVKGKGIMTTYWLCKKNAGNIVSYNQAS